MANGARPTLAARAKAGWRNDAIVMSSPVGYRGAERSNINRPTMPALESVHDVPIAS